MEYRNALEQDDLLILVEYSIIYTTGTPSDYTAEDLFICRMFEGSDYIDSVAPYSDGHTNKYGYSNGLMSYYFSARDAESLGLTWGDVYTFTLSGNPLIDWTAGTPPSTSKTGVDLAFDGNDYSSIDTQIRTRLSIYINEFEDAWDLENGDLADRSSGAPVFTTTGEGYFSNVIDNLSEIAPSLFSTSKTNIDYLYPESYIMYYCSGTYPNAYYPIYLEGGSDCRVGAIFSPNQTGYVESVESLFSRSGLGAGTITVDIYHSTSGSITGTSLCHGIFNSADISANPLTEWYSVSMGTPAKVIKGYEYTVTYRSGTGSIINRLDSIWNQYATCNNGGSVFTNDSWVTINTDPDSIMPLTVIRYANSYSDELAESVNDHSIFRITPVAEMFGASRLLVAAVVAVILIFYIMVWGRNTSGTTANATIVAMFALIGMSILLPIGIAIAGVVIFLLGLTGVYILFFRGSGA